MHQNTSPRTRPPIQFGIGTLLIVTAALAVLLGTLRWLGVPPAALALILGILFVAALAALALVVALLRGMDNEDREHRADLSDRADPDDPESRSPY